MRLITFELMRIICCCQVVSIHFGKTLPFSDLAVPIFVLIAFYFARLSSFRSLLHRSVRIYMPFAFWGIIGLTALSFVKPRFDWSVFVSQMLLGAPANAPLYFLLEILVFSWGVWFLSLSSAHWHRFLAGSVVLISLFLQYSGINHMVFSKLSLIVGIVLGRGVELVSYAMIGWHLSGLKVKRRKWFVIGVSLICVGLMMRLGKVFIICHEFGSGGIDRLMIVCGICMVAAIPRDWLSGSHVGRVICVISGLTAGIYYMHKIIGGLIAHLGYFRNDGIWLPIVVIISTGICCYLMKQIKYTRWMVK